MPDYYNIIRTFENNSTEFLSNGGLFNSLTPQTP